MNLNRQLVNAMPESFLKGKKTGSHVASATEDVET